MIYLFEGFALDTDRHELQHEGARVDLQPKVLSLLLHLVRNRGRVVGREELFREVWPDVVVSDDALFHALKKARSALGDDGAAQRIIETVPRVGYRFVATVQEREEAVGEPARGSRFFREAPGAETGLVGRGTELAALRKALGAALGGAGRIVLLSGEAGIGKSRLAREIAGTARERGAEVHEARSWEGEGAPPFWVWVQILRAYQETWDGEALASTMGDGAREIARLVPSLAEQFGLTVPPVRDSEDARFRQMDASARFLVHAARVRPQVLVLEDLHWAPPATLQMLSFLAGEVASERILVIATFREHETGSEGALEAAIAACAQRDVLVHLRLLGLSAQDLVELVRRAAGFVPSPTLAAALHRETGGNPFFVREIAQLSAGAREAEQELAKRLALHPSAIPDGIRSVLGRRLSLLSEDCRKVITLASVAGELSLALLARTCELPREKLLDALEEALAANLLELDPGPPPLYRFAHALLREAAYLSTPEPARVLLHLRVAEALERHHAGRLASVVPALAHHYGRAALVGDGMKAVDYAKWAGDLATTALSYEEAVACYERGLAALDLLPSAENVRKRAELLVCAGFARQNAGDNEVGRILLREAADLARAAGDANLLSFAALGFAELGFGMTEGEPVSLLEAAMAAPGQRPDFLYVGLRVALSIHLSNVPARHAEALALLNEADTKALGDPRLLGYALTARASVLRLHAAGTPEDRLALLRRAGGLLAESGDRTVEMLNWGQIRGALVELGDLDGAMAANARIEGFLAHLRSELWSYISISVQVLPAMLEGRFDDAEAHVGAAFSSTTGQRFSLTVKLAVVAMVRCERQRLAELLPIIDRIRQDLPGLPVVRAVRALALLEAGDGGEARLELDQLARDDFRELVGTESWIFACAVLADICTELGDEARARVLMDLLEPRAQYCVSVSNGLFCYGPVALHLGVLAVTLRSWEAAERHLDAALERAKALRSPVWEAHALAARARLHLARGSRGDPARGLALARKARTIAAPRGMQRLLHGLPA